MSWNPLTLNASTKHEQSAYGLNISSPITTANKTRAMPSCFQQKLPNESPRPTPTSHNQRPGVLPRISITPPISEDLEPWTRSSSNSPVSPLESSLPLPPPLPLHITKHSSSGRDHIDGPTPIFSKEIDGPTSKVPSNRYSLFYECLRSSSKIREGPYGGRKSWLASAFDANKTTNQTSPSICFSKRQSAHNPKDGGPSSKKHLFRSTMCCIALIMIILLLTIIGLVVANKLELHNISQRLPKNLATATTSVGASTSWNSAPVTTTSTPTQTRAIQVTTSAIFATPQPSHGTTPLSLSKSSTSSTKSTLNTLTVTDRIRRDEHANNKENIQITTSVFDERSESAGSTTTTTKTIPATVTLTSTRSLDQNGLHPTLYSDSTSMIRSSVQPSSTAHLTSTTLQSFANRQFHAPFAWANLKKIGRGASIRMLHDETPTTALRSMGD